MNQTAPTHATVETSAPGQPNKGKVFVAVHAHMDDLAYFGAGLCAKLIAEGYTGYVVRTTNDEHSGGGTNAQNILSTETEHAAMAKVLGLKDVFELYYRNDRMEEISKSDLRGRLMLIYRMLKADTVISFHPDSSAGLDPDQRTTGRIAAEAVDLCSNPHENWEHMEAGFPARRVETCYYFCASAEAPFNRVVDIGPHVEKKIDAIAACRTRGGGNLGSELRASLAREGKRLPVLGGDDRTADREYIRHFVLDNDRDFAKPHGLQFAERFFYLDRRVLARTKVDEYVAKNALRA